jgi:hypothetical protein
VADSALASYEPLNADSSGYAPGSPEWWFKRLACSLRDRREGRAGGRTWSRKLDKPCRIPPGLETLHDYYVGDPPLTGYADGWGDAFRIVARMGRLNMAENICNAKTNRMHLRGFRTSAANDDLGDQRAREIMRATEYAIVAGEVHDMMAWARVGYVMVTPPIDGMVTISAKDPRQTITIHDPQTGKPLAGLTMFRDDWDYAHVAHMYLVDPDTGETLHFPLRKESRSALVYGSKKFADGWELTDTVAVLPRFPIIPFNNRGGRGEFEYHLDTIDRINDQVMDKLVIAKVQAFRQMAIKGLPDKVVKIVDGKPVEVEIDYSNAFEAAPGSLWQLPKDAELWESTPTDMGPLRLSIKDDLMDLGVATGTSLPSIAPDMTQGSAAGAISQKEAELGATDQMILRAGVSHAKVLSVAFEFMDDPNRAKIAGLEPMWAPTERFSITDMASADHNAGSLPKAEKWTRIWQVDPADVQRLRLLEGADLLTTPAPAPAGGASGVPPVTFLPPGQQPTAEPSGQSG